MNNNKINEFINSKPEVIDVIGYGSGLIHQNGYNNNAKKQIDLILTVSNLDSFHKENFTNNPDEYNKFVMPFLNAINHLGTDINYISNINYKNDIFKIGIISQKDLVDDLKTWKNFFIAGRCQKPVCMIKTSEAVNNLIIKNRLNALKASLIIRNSDKISQQELFETICSLSYLGDIRMLFKCENPNKIKNIVQGSYDNFESIYNPLSNDFYYISNGILNINKEALIKDLYLMPNNLVDYLNIKGINQETLTVEDLETLKSLIIKYLTNTNLVSSTCQPIKSLLLNGTSKSLNYLGEKIKKGKM